jgi:hypothetical protein
MDVGTCSTCGQPLVLDRRAGSASCPCGAASIPAAFMRTGRGTHEPEARAGGEERVKPLLVGESPSRTGDRYHRFPLSGAPARTLCTCAGWEPDGPASEPGSWTWALYDRFETINVFRRWHEATPWSAPEARVRATRIVDNHQRTRTFVLLGARVKAAFGVTAPFFTWVTYCPDGEAIGRIVAIPHPSGRNLLLNEPAMRDAIGATLRYAVSERRP